MGIDACAEGMRELSGRALSRPSRGGAGNALFVRAAVESLPRDLRGVADEVTVVLPWGSLLSVVLGADAESLRAVRGICQPGARLDVVLAIDPDRDAGEWRRLGIEPPRTVEEVVFRQSAGYRAAGFRAMTARELTMADLRDAPSTWARRLGSGRARRLVGLTAVACDAS